MNPTKELIKYIYPFLDLISDRFQDIMIQEDYSLATISISHPVHIENKLLIESKKGTVSVLYRVNSNFNSPIGLQTRANCTLHSP